VVIDSEDEYHMDKPMLHILVELGILWFTLFMVLFIVDGFL